MTLNGVAAQIGDIAAITNDTVTAAVTERLPRDRDDVTVDDVVASAADYLLDQLIDIFAVSFDLSILEAGGRLADCEDMREWYRAELLIWKFDMVDAVRQHLRACVEVH